MYQGRIWRDRGKERGRGREMRKTAGLDA